MLIPLALCGLTFIIVILEHFTLGKLWKHCELARRALGVATVLSIAGIGVLVSLVPPEVWVFFFALFASAGTGLVASVVTENAISERRRIEVLKKHYEATDEGN